MNGFNLVSNGEAVAWYETEQEAIVGAAEFLEVWGQEPDHWQLYIISDDGEVEIRDEELMARIRTCGI